MASNDCLGLESMGWSFESLRICIKDGRKGYLGRVAESSKGGLMKENQS